MESANATSTGQGSAVTALLARATRSVCSHMAARGLMRRTVIYVRLMRPGARTGFVSAMLTGPGRTVACTRACAIRFARGVLARALWTVFSALRTRSGTTRKCAGARVTGRAAIAMYTSDVVTLNATQGSALGPIATNASSAQTTATPVP
jgi:hypothetical protein